MFYMSVHCDPTENVSMPRNTPCLKNFGVRLHFVKHLLRSFTVSCFSSSLCPSFTPPPSFHPPFLHSFRWSCPPFCLSILPSILDCVLPPFIVSILPFLRLSLYSFIVSFLTSIIVTSLPSLLPVLFPGSLFIHSDSKFSI